MLEFVFGAGVGGILGVFVGVIIATWAQENANGRRY